MSESEFWSISVLFLLLIFSVNFQLYKINSKLTSFAKEYELVEQEFYKEIYWFCVYHPNDPECRKEIK